MGFSTILIISLAAGAIIVIGGGLLMYMGNLMRSAYELKVQINQEVEERLTKMGEDLDKKSRWIKRDLLEEIEKIRAAMQTDNARKIGDLAEPMLKQLEALEAAIRADQSKLVKMIEEDRQVITGLDQRMKGLHRQVKAKDEDKAEPASARSMDEEAAVQAARDAAGTPPALAEANDKAATQQASPPAKPAGGVKPMVLQDLGKG